MLFRYNYTMKHYFFKQQFRDSTIISSVIAISLALLLAFSSCAGGAAVYNGLGKARDQVPFMSNAKTGTFPSGMRYYLLENTKPEGRAFLTLAVNAGSVLENEDERGLAHFVEHMAFNGSARFPKSELVNYLRSLGMRFGPEVNAHTSFDETVYGIEVPVEIGPDGRKIIPEKALAVIDDWSYSVTFNPDDVDNERLVIMEEYRSRLGARERLGRDIYPLLFRGSPYAERLPIGLPEIIENAPAERMEAFYRKWYRPENMAVIIVGDFDAASLEASLSEHFPGHEEWKKAEYTDQPFKRPVFNLSEPKRGSLETLVLTDAELSRSSVELYWKRRAEVPRQDLSYYREGLIDYLAHTMLSLRFEEETVKPETPYVYAGAGMANYGYSSRFYVLVAGAKTGSVSASLRELLLVKESLSRYGFTQEETDSAKASLVSYLEQMVSEKDRQSSDSYVMTFTRHFLNGETVPDLEWELEAAKMLLPGITLKEINKTVKNYFADDDLTVIITAPDAEKDNLPDAGNIKALAAETRLAKIEAPSKNAALQKAGADGGLLPYTPLAGTIVSEETEKDTAGRGPDVIRWKLSNGAEVILKETTNRNSEISFYAQARGGTMSVPDEMAVSASLAAEMLNASGLGPYSKPELTRILLDKQVSMSFWAQAFLRGFQGSAAVKDIKTLFEMIHLEFAQSRFDPDAVQAMMDQKRSSMAFQENDPNVVFRREISRTIYGNPRFHPLELFDLDRANMDEAMAFIRACLNPGDYCFVFTGNLDLPLIRTMVETYLASVPDSESFNEWAYVDPQRPLDANKDIYRGKEERSTVYLGWFRAEPFTEEKSAAVSVLTEYLDIKLEEEIRESLGGVYSISSWVSLSPIPDGELSGGAFFICDPKRAMELAAAVKNEFLKIAVGKVDAGIFEKAVEALIQDYEQSVESNLYIAQSYANSALIYHSPMSRLDKRPGLYRAVSHGDIQKAASQLLGGNCAQLTLYPE